MDKITKPVTAGFFIKMTLIKFEKNYFIEKRDLFLIGVDEVGRGSWAGPVVSAAVALNQKNFKKFKKLKLKDSKKLTPAQRNKLFPEIINSSKIAIGLKSEKIIDNKNILIATLLSMQQAVTKINIPEALVLVDGVNKIPKIKNKQKTIVHGDNKIYCIAAASIVAKVVRDKIMASYHKKYPEYNFLQNKGYGTKEHWIKLKKYGPSPIHRRSFRPVKNLLND